MYFFPYSGTFSFPPSTNIHQDIKNPLYCACLRKLAIWPRKVTERRCPDVDHEHNDWHLWDWLVRTRLPCFRKLSFQFHSNVHQNTQSPICCVRKLAILHRRKWLAEDGWRGSHESNDSISWEGLICTCCTCWSCSPLHFLASIRKNAQSPICCVRKLAIFYRNCDWPKLDMELLMNRTIGFHEKYSCVHVFLVSTIFPLHFTQMHIKKLKVRCVV